MFGKIFVVAILLLQADLSVLAQGIFDPPVFTEAVCTGTNQWTTWFDTSDPNMSQGEFEITNHIMQNYPMFICPFPIAIEVRRTTRSLMSTGSTSVNVSFLLGTNDQGWKSNSNWRYLPCQSQRWFPLFKSANHRLQTEDVHGLSSTLLLLEVGHWTRSNGAGSNNTCPCTDRCTCR